MGHQAPIREVFQTVTATLSCDGQLAWTWQRTIVTEKPVEHIQDADADPEPELDEVLELLLSNALKEVLGEKWYPLPGWELRKLITEVPVEVYDDDDGDDEDARSALRYSLQSRVLGIDE